MELSFTCCWIYTVDLKCKTQELMKHKQNETQYFTKLQHHRKERVVFSDYYFFYVNLIKRVVCLVHVLSDLFKFYVFLSVYFLKCSVFYLFFVNS